MRELKFRVWDKENKNMSTVGALDWDMNYNVITCNTKETKLYNLGHEDLDFELMQYTGLRDKNKKEIYEGDIVVISHKGKKNRKVDVCFGHGGFIISAFNPDGYEFLAYKTESLSYQVEIIGNIYENPGLLVYKEE